MGGKPVPYQNVCVHHIPSRMSLCCLDSCWHKVFLLERDDSYIELLSNCLFKLPFCPCLCPFLASHRGDYPTLSLFGSYVVRFIFTFPMSFHDGVMGMVTVDPQLE